VKLIGDAHLRSAYKTVSGSFLEIAGPVSDSSRSGCPVKERFTLRRIKATEARQVLQLAQSSKTSIADREQDHAE
jgi:hypothetical protein